MRGRRLNYKKTIRKCILNTSVCLLSILISFLFCESLIRIFYKQNVVLFPRYHTDASYGEYSIRRLRPNLEFWHTTVDGSWKFTTNSQGFRSYRDFSYDKPDGLLRIICLGDSHTQGFEARQDHTYSAVIEKYLSNHGYDVEVFNTGISGFSTAEELVFLENEGIKYKPHFVVLGFYANDFEDNIKAGLFELSDDGLKVKKREHIPGVRIQNILYKFSLLRYLGENSYFYSLLFNSTWAFFKEQLYSKEKAQLLTELAVPSEELTGYKIQLTARLIERMYSFCRKNDITLVILDIPRIDGEGFRSSVPDEIYQLITNNSDIFVNSEEVLKDYNHVIEIHNPHGHRHISEFAHALLGVSIAKEIIAEEGDL